MKVLPKGTMAKVNKNVAAAKAVKPAEMAPSGTVKKVVTQKTVHYGSDSVKAAKPAPLGMKKK